MTNFHSGINLGLPLAVYTRKQDKRQVFAVNAGVPISNKTMVTTGTKHAQACVNKTLAWRKWKRCPHIDHTWLNWKAHWTAAFTKMHDINHMTAGNKVFGANQAAELDQAQQMAYSLNNLVNATLQKNITIKNLVATNATLTKAIADIQLSIAQMFAMAFSLDNLANATIQKNTTIKNLVITNATLTKAIANIQRSIAQMCTAGIPQTEFEL